MLLPPDGAAVQNLNVEFSWGDVLGAIACQLRVYRTLGDAQNDLPFSWQWSNTWCNSLERDFTAAGTYYWRTLARDAAAWGSLSPIRSFTIVVPSYTASGKITDQDQNPIAGVTIYAGVDQIAITDAGGSYTLSGLLPGAYTLQPYKAGYTFALTSRAITCPTEPVRP